MTDYIDFWTLYEKGREYGFKDPVYYGGWHRGQDIPGANKTVPWLNKDVPLLHPGLQPYWKGQQPKLGGVFVYKVGSEFWAYCHVRPTGTGFRISSWSDPIEWRGSSWAGPHVHLVRSKTWDAAWNTNRAVLDPRPVIRTKLAEAEKKEDDMATPKEIWDYFARQELSPADPLRSGTKFPKGNWADLLRYNQRFSRATYENQAVTNAQITALTAAVKALSESKGIDAKAIQKTVDDAVKNAVGKITFTVDE